MSKPRTKNQRIEAAIKILEDYISEQVEEVMDQPTIYLLVGKIKAMCHFTNEEWNKWAAKKMRLYPWPFLCQPGWKYTLNTEYLRMQPTPKEYDGNRQAFEKDASKNLRMRFYSKRLRCAETLQRDFAKVSPELAGFLDGATPRGLFDFLNEQGLDPYRAYKAMGEIGSIPEQFKEDFGELLLEAEN